MCTALLLAKAFRHIYAYVPWIERKGKQMSKACEKKRIDSRRSLGFDLCIHLRISDSF